MAHKSFDNEHPWLTRKIKKAYWKIIKFFRISSFVYSFYYGRIKIRINSSDTSVGKFVFLENFETETVRFIAKYVKPGDEIFDIGANIGYFSLLFSYLIGAKGHVHAFEPSTREFLQLCENVKLNHSKNLYLNQIAISNDNQYVQMNVLDNVRFGAYNSISLITHPEVKNQKINTELVRALTLDRYLQLFPDTMPKLVKIDVEGFENQVLEGMKHCVNTLDCPCLIIEICETTHNDGINGPIKLIETLKSFGYQLFSPDPNGNLRPYSIGTTINCIALKENQFSSLIEKGITVLSE